MESKCKQEEKAAKKADKNGREWLQCCCSHWIREECVEEYVSLSSGALKLCPLSDNYNFMVARCINFCIAVFYMY